MKHLNIVKKKIFEQNGEQKTKWLPPAGTLKVQDSGKMFIEMNDGVEYYVFEQKDREQKPKQEATINVDEAVVPF